TGLLTTGLLSGGLLGGGLLGGRFLDGGLLTTGLLSDRLLGGRLLGGRLLDGRLLDGGLLGDVGPSLVVGRGRLLVFRGLGRVGLSLRGFQSAEERFVEGLRAVALEPCSAVARAATRLAPG
ncbi:MAG TPA: hypothetical protein VEP49_20370, partial [Acidimicrobiia bacterium]|nr:hypothetical protein [Acidimicrobiia bacterium]